MATITIFFCYFKVIFYLRLKISVKFQYTNVPHCLKVVSVKAAINRLENRKPDSSPVWKKQRFQLFDVVTLFRIEIWTIGTSMKFWSCRHDQKKFMDVSLANNTFLSRMSKGKQKHTIQKVRWGRITDRGFSDGSLLNQNEIASYKCI